METFIDFGLIFVIVLAVLAGAGGIAGFCESLWNRDHVLDKRWNRRWNK